MYRNNISFVVKSSLIAATLISSNVALADDDGYNNQPITVYFTRHAEKKTTSEVVVGAQTPVFNDSEGPSVGKTRVDVCGSEKCAEELSDRGVQRAKLLADWFARRGVVDTLDAVYSSHKLRTLQTVEPTATAAGLTVNQLPANRSELSPEGTEPSECPTIAAILDTPPGDTILVAGHSGTLYDIMGDGNAFCEGLGLLTDGDPSSDRFPKAGSKGKVADFGDIWKVVIRNGNVKFKYRVNLDNDRLRVQERVN